MVFRSRCVTTLVATGILLVAPLVIEGLAVGDRSKLNRLAASRCVEDLLGFVHMDDDDVEKAFTLYDANEIRRERTIKNFMVVQMYIVAFCRLYSG
jgi:hypothetical protein